MKVKLIKYDYDSDYYSFFISKYDDLPVPTSYSIASSFGLSTKVFVDILIDKVIKHNDITFERSANGVIYNVIFKLNNTPKDVYIERFKNFFVKELTLLSF